MNAQLNEKPLESGAFPFPLVDGPRESIFVTWLRDHSNFMAGNGLSDVLRMIAVLVRGIAINALILLPPLLLIALAVSFVYGGMLTDWDQQRTDRTTGQHLADKHAACQHKVPEQAQEEWSTLFVDGLSGLASLLQDSTVSAAEKAAMARYEKMDSEVRQAKVGKPVNLFLSRPVLSCKAGWTKWMQDHTGLNPPFLLTPLLLLVFVASMLAYPVLATMSGIARYRLGLIRGSQSSVKLRDRYERLFGLGLGLLLALALFELLPRVIYLYSQLRLQQFGDGMPWKHYLAVATMAIVGLSGAPKLLAMLSGLWKSLAMILIALVGLLAPMVVIVVVSDLVLYRPMPLTHQNLLYLVLTLVVTPGIYVAVALIALVVGSIRKTFAAVEYRAMGQLVVGVLVAHACLIVLMLAIYCFVFMLYRSHPEWVPDVLLATKSLAGDDLHNYGDLAAYFVLGCALEIWLFAWLTADVNLTSIHAHYRDRLATAFLLTVNARGEVDVERDIPLTELSQHGTGSVAPYHLINAALNLSGSKDRQLRNRKSDFFVFSKKYIGGDKTGYCRSTTMAMVFPQINLAGAMAISAAAASPNMGRFTSTFLAPVMTLINIRFGVWLPNPGLLEERLPTGPRHRTAAERLPGHAPGFTFVEVFADELEAMARRWAQMGSMGAQRSLAEGHLPTAAHRLAGLAFSGGGIRSATINLGFAQALHRAGLFAHFDYLSTVSGGGYIGAAISARMRCGPSPTDDLAGTAVFATAARDAQVGDFADRIDTHGSPMRSQIAGTVSLEQADHGQKIVRVEGASHEGQPAEVHEYRYTRFDQLLVKSGERISAQHLLVKQQNSYGHQFQWRVRPKALLLEMTLRPNELYPWVNVSDGGHIENMACIELLRRRCKYIVIGDGESDAEMHFIGLSTLMRTARIDLGVHIDINIDALRLEAQACSGSHFAIGRITYPGASDADRHGYLLYLKSSCTGDEDEVIAAYRHQRMSFPHESTADQFFTEEQFEAYRSLGQHIAEQALAAMMPMSSPGVADFAAFEQGFQTLWEARKQPRAPPSAN